MNNCSGIDSQAYRDEWYSPRLGALYAVMGVVFQAIEIPCIIVMTDKDLWINSCYKVMFIVGVLDICTLWVNAVVPSIYMFIPLSIDCHPIAMQILSCLMCQLFWNAYCFMAVVLIMNRCVFLESPSKWHERLFANGRVWVWAAAALAYGCMFVAVYASPYGTIQFHSGIGTFIWPSTDVVSTFSSIPTYFRPVVAP
uniref:7TM GPCR serpentine receptor class x (Srx) domain-containing protein n=1 Tax=Plectus sambesii TaxID=2011161 RepID=A0A914XPZ3_9BILA